MIAGVLVVACAFVGCHYVMAKLRMAWAADQVRVFRLMEAKANGSGDVAEMGGILGYVVNHYPSGTKQVADSHLDQIVESTRADSVTAIIARMRSVTGEELGPDPDAWLKKYSSARSPFTSSK